MRIVPESTDYRRAEAQEVREALVALLDEESSVEALCPLAKRTTLRVGGPADVLVEPSGVEALATVARFAHERRVPIFCLGRGSNLLVKEGGVAGIVVSLSHPSFRRIDIQGHHLTAGAGVRLKTLAMEAKKAGLGGLEFLEGIPGSVGGALCMNAGAMGVEIFDVTLSLRVVTESGAIEQWDAKETPHRYRECPALHRCFAVEATLQGCPDTQENIARRLSESNRKRWDSQPAKPSSGCTFKNPDSVPAGRLIDELGLKKTTVGAAEVSEVHANFLINNGGASSRDFLELIEIIREKARRERGIELRTEVQIVGEDE